MRTQSSLFLAQTVDSIGLSSRDIPSKVGASSDSQYSPQLEVEPDHPVSSGVLKISRVSSKSF